MLSFICQSCHHIVLSSQQFGYSLDLLYHHFKLFTDEYEKSSQNTSLSVYIASAR